MKGMKKSYTAGLKPNALLADMTIARLNMDILPINSLTRVVEQTHHDERQQQQRRQPPRKQEKIAPAPVYTPDGHLEEGAVSKIDVVA
jgi:hypothetical protein